MIKVYLPDEEPAVKTKIITLGYFQNKLHCGHYQFLHKRWSGYYEDVHGRVCFEKVKKK